MTEAGAAGAVTAPARWLRPARRSGAADAGHRAERRLGWAMVAPTVILLALITAFPLVYNLWNSFHHVNLANAAQAQSFAGTSNYRALVTTPGFVGALTRTVGFTAVTIVVDTVVGLGLALMLNRAFPGRGVLRAAILVPWAVPTVVSASLWKTMFDPRAGFVDYLLNAAHLPGAHVTWLAGQWTSWAAIVTADAWKNIPFVAIILLAGLQVIPRDIYEAARIDGASTWQAFRRLTLPLLKPALLVALIFRTLQAFLVFDVIYIMTGGGPGSTTETLSYLNWHAFLVDTDFGYGGAVSVSLVVISLVIAGLYVRLLRPAT